MNFIGAVDPSLKPILEKATTIAVIGCSERPFRTSNTISNYLKDAGYRIIPVNPNYDFVLGEKCYHSVDDIPDTTRIDIVDIFRNPLFTASAVEDIIKRIARTGEKPLIWTQLGVSSPSAHKLATAAGLTYIKNRCLAVDHEHLFS